MSLAFYYVITQITFGALALTPLIPFEVFGASFFRVNAGIFFLTGCLAWSWLPVPAPTASTVVWGEFVLFHAAMLALAAYNLALWRRKDTPALGYCVTASALGMAAVVAGGFACPVPLSPGWQHAGLAASFAASAWVTGSALFGMLVGHWYLMKPMLPFEPLILVSRVFGLGTIAAAVLFGVNQVGQLLTAPVWALGMAWSPVAVIDLFVWVRLAVGVLAPLGLAYMIVESSRLRANMSATGLFYVAFAACAAGDLVARALLVARHLVL
ncbi:MAG: hypothetical protein HY816_21525 [Candidatus Wallbacteria bacterium]|nr:hypothetical protein [Candidatus Wallbacteria bacterium]